MRSNVLVGLLAGSTMPRGSPLNGVAMTPACLVQLVYSVGRNDEKWPRRRNVGAAIGNGQLG